MCIRDRYGTGQGATGVYYPETVKVGGARGAVQGSDQALLAYVVAEEGGPGAGERVALPRPAPAGAGLIDSASPSHAADSNPLERR